MARLASIAKGGYYWTPFRMLMGIAKLVQLVPEAGVTVPIRVIDPSAGTGQALQFLIRTLQKETPTLKVETYGVELNAERAAQAETRLDNVLPADGISVKITDRSMDLVFCNPPYDLENSPEGRLEHKFLIKSTRLLKSKGVLIYIIPRYVLQDSADWLAQFYENHLIRQFPEPEFAQFDQIVVVATRKSQKRPNPKHSEELCQMSSGAREIKTLSCPDHSQYAEIIQELRDSNWGDTAELRQDSAYNLANQDKLESAGTPPKQRVSITPNRKNPKIGFAHGEFHLGEALREAGQVGVWANRERRDWLTLVPSRAMQINPPLMPMRIGMTSQFLQIGLGNNLLLQDGSSAIVIKGKTVKQWRMVDEEFDDEGKVTKRIFKEVISSEITVINLKTGQLDIVDNSGLQELVQRYKDSIQAQMLLNYPPLYLPTKPETRQAQVKAARRAVYADAKAKGTLDHNGKFKLGKPEVKLKQALKLLELIWAIEQGLAKLFSHSKKPKGGQSIVIGAATLALKVLGFATMECEMGTGKTPMGIWAIYLSGCGRPLITAPTHLVEKWLREVKETLPGADGMIVSTITELEEARLRILKHEEKVKRLYPKPNAAAGEHYPPFFTIMSTEPMKTESAWTLRAVYHPPRGESLWQTVKVKSGDQRLEKAVLRKEYAEEGHYPKDKEGNLVLTVDTKKILMYPHCPRCDAPLLDAKGNPLDLSGKPKHMLFCTSPVPETVRQKKLLTHSNGAKEWVCGEPIWQRKSKLINSGIRAAWELACKPALPDPATGATTRPIPNLYQAAWETRPEYRDSTPSGIRRVKLSKYVQVKMNHFFDLFVGDEIHQMKAKGSARGISAGRMAMACGQMLTLTGTFGDGYSSNVMHLLLRFTDPKLRKLWKKGDERRWAKKYGIIKATRYGAGGAPGEYEEAEIDGAQSDRKIERGTLNLEEVPGISPEIALMTIPHTAYLSLMDVVDNLPPYTEYPNAAIPLDKTARGYYSEEYGSLLAGKPLPSQEEAYLHLRDRLLSAVKAQAARGSHRLIGAMVHSLLAWLDNPTAREIVQDPVTKLVVATAPALPPEMLYPKEQMLVDLLRQERAAGRKVIIYLSYSKSRGMLERVREVCRRAYPTIRVAALQNDNSRGREAWIEQQVTKGCDVLITHPKKVEVGLDLVKFQTIVFYNIYYVTQTVEQAKKRCWRIGQAYPCDTYFWAYGNSAQATGLKHLARKIYAASKLKGQILDEGIVDILDDDDEMSMLKAIARAITADPDGKGDTTNLESLMKTHLQEQAVQAAFMVNDPEANWADVTQAIEDLYNYTYVEADDTTPNSPYNGLLNVRLLDEGEKSEESPVSVIESSLSSKEKPEEGAQEPEKVVSFQPETNQVLLAEFEPKTTAPVVESENISLPFADHEEEEEGFIKKAPATMVKPTLEEFTKNVLKKRKLGGAVNTTKEASPKTLLDFL